MLKRKGNNKKKQWKYIYILFSLIEHLGQLKSNQIKRIQVSSTWNHGSCQFPIAKEGKYTNNVFASSSPEQLGKFKVNST